MVPGNTVAHQNGQQTNVPTLLERNTTYYHVPASPSNKESSDLDVTAVHMEMVHKTTSIPQL